MRFWRMRWRCRRALEKTKKRSTTCISSGRPRQHRAFCYRDIWRKASSQRYVDFAFISGQLRQSRVSRPLLQPCAAYTDAMKTMTARLPTHPYIAHPSALRTTSNLHSLSRCATLNVSAASVLTARLQPPSPTYSFVSDYVFPEREQEIGMDVAGYSRVFTAGLALKVGLG